jgi:hypothetical protein
VALAKEDAEMSIRRIVMVCLVALFFAAVPALN